MYVWATLFTVTANRMQNVHRTYIGKILCKHINWKLCCNFSLFSFSFGEPNAIKYPFHLISNCFSSLLLRHLFIAMVRLRCSNCNWKKTIPFLLDYYISIFHKQWATSIFYSVLVSCALVEILTGSKDLKLILFENYYYY